VLDVIRHTDHGLGWSAVWHSAAEYELPFLVNCYRLDLHPAGLEKDRIFPHCAPHSEICQ
jgi:hypothetical protein